MNNQAICFSSVSARMKLYLILMLLICISFVLMIGCNNKVEHPKSVFQKKGALADSSMASTKWNISIDSAWARPTKAGMTSAAYFKLENYGSAPDSLIRVSSNASKDVQIHLSYLNDGIMMMEEQPFVAIQPTEQISFEPGGYHIMIIQPTMDLNEGDSISFLLYFNSGMIIDETIQIGNPKL